VWSVQEEGGLVGAQFAATTMGASTKRIYSIDTFVSSETPLESPHFAFVRLGRGPVLRAIESGSISPPAVREMVTAAARTAGIPLQTGLTQGGTDGSAFTFYGAPNTGLSWPGRYSHTPAEVLDLRDVERLSVLIATLIGQR
jgi:putative aminopeptidase FrvX